MRGILWWERCYKWNSINSLVNYNNVEFIHVFWLIVAVPCQDIASLMLSLLVTVTTVYNVQFTYDTFWYTIAVLMRSINRRLTHNAY